MRLFCTPILLFLACRTGPLSATDPSPSFGARSTAISLTSLGCVAADVAQLRPFDLQWSRADNRLTVDLYGGLYGSGNGSCDKLHGGAVVDSVADTLFLFFAGDESCSNRCGDSFSAVELVVSDALADLSQAPSIEITLGVDRPDRHSVIVPSLTIPTKSDYHRYVPVITHATTAPPAEGKRLLAVTYESAACPAFESGFGALYSADKTYVVPYVRSSAETEPCQAMAKGEYLLDAYDRPAFALSKSAEGAFSLIRAD